MMPLGGMGLDLYSPSLPYIEAFMNTSHSLVKFSMSIYLFGYAFGQLFFGVISDAKGRKTPLLWGLSTYVLASYLCTATHQIQWFLALRLIQGLSVAATAVMCKSILGDCFKDKELAKATSWLVIAWGLGPIVAPLIGGYLQYHINWQANFFFYTSYGLICLLLVWFFLPETQQIKRTLNMKHITTDVVFILKNNYLFILGVILVSIGYSIIATFNLLGPYLIQSLLHYNPAAYGHIVLNLGVAFFLGSISNRLLLKRVDAILLIKIAVLLFFIISIFMQALAMITPLSLTNLLVPSLCIFFFSGWIIPNGMAKCISLYPKKAGTSSAVMSFLFILVTSLITAGISLIPIHSELVLSLSYCVLAFIGLFVFFGLKYL